MKNNSYHQLIFLLLGVVIIGFLWWIGNELEFRTDRIPLIKNVFGSLFENRCIERLINTGQSAFLGLLLSCIIAFIGVVIVSLIPKLEGIITSQLLLIQITPILALVPILMVFKFSSYDCYIAASTAISFFPLYIAGTTSLNNGVPDKIIKLAEVYHTSRWKQFWYFKSGYVIDRMLGVLPLSAPLSVVGAITGEYVAGGKDSNLGIFIAQTVNGNYDIESRYVGLVLSFFAGIVFYLVGFLIHKKYAKYVRLDKA